MATAKIFPKPSQVTGTHSNMPLLLTPSLVPDIGSLTLAEAQSIRIYTDSGLTTEVARDVVSADEIHFKAPSASSSMEFWVDWDGVRSDYAVTDTYGRNAVWSDYTAVYHLKDGSGTTATDATGNANGTLSNSALWGSNSKFGASVGITADNANHMLTGVSGSFDNVSITSWIYVADNTGSQNSSSLWGSRSGTNWLWSYFDDGNLAGQREIEYHRRAGSVELQVIAEATSVWRHHAFTGQRNTSGGAISYRNASVVDTANTTNAAYNLSTINIALLGVNVDGTVSRCIQTGTHMSEWRIRSSILSSGWITTEYNNQNDNAAFWDSDPAGGGGGAVSPQFLGFAGLG